jgi:hypothetical protein
MAHLIGQNVVITVPESFYKDAKDHPIETFGKIVRFRVRYAGTVNEYVLYQIDSDKCITTENSIINLYRRADFVIVE